MARRTKKGSGRAVIPAHRPNGRQAAETATPDSTGAGRPGLVMQLPLVLAADVHEPHARRRKATVLPHDPECPRCGFQRSHLSDWPAPALLAKRCPSCGLVAQYVLSIVLAGRQARRAG
ncbi:hypothetical protein [Streptosporangium sandarakinum]|uniref:hypothetical protein n=1 Tax=Streptosporangium sandarakinum TaxID=1260955 RepID=UPI00371D4B51